MENLLKQTKGVGTVYYDMSNSRKCDIAGLWVMPLNSNAKRPKELKQQSNIFKFTLLPSKQKYFNENAET